MIILINGPLGIGKTTLSFELQKHLPASVMLDGDYICRVHPFDLHSKERLEYLYKTCQLLIQHHKKNGYEFFVLNYVFEKEEELGKFKSYMEELGEQTHCFLIVASKEDLEKRIKKRNHANWKSEILRAHELHDILFKTDENLGLKLDSNDNSLAEIIQLICESVGIE